MEGQPLGMKDTHHVPSAWLTVLPLNQRQCSVREKETSYHSFLPRAFWAPSAHKCHKEKASPLFTHLPMCSKLWCFYLRREYSCLLPLKSGRGRFLGSSPWPCCLFSCLKPGEGNRMVKHSSPPRILPSSRLSAQSPLWKLPSQTAPPGTPTLLIRILLPWLSRALGL